MLHSSPLGPALNDKNLFPLALTQLLQRRCSFSGWDDRQEACVSLELMQPTERAEFYS